MRGMKGKKAVSGFTLISVFKFVIGALVTVFLFTAIWTFFGPKEKAEASTLKGMDDIVAKLDEIKVGQAVIAYGYVDKDAAIIGFSSDQLKAGEFSRPKQCGARSNSCICAFKVGYEGLDAAVIKPEKAIECKGYPGESISAIKGSTDDSLNSRYQGTGKGLDFAIFGLGGASFTSTMTLSEKGLLSVDSRLTRAEGAWPASGSAKFPPLTLKK